MLPEAVDNLYKRMMHRIRQQFALLTMSSTTSRDSRARRAKRERVPVDPAILREIDSPEHRQRTDQLEKIYREGGASALTAAAYGMSREQAERFGSAYRPTLR